MKNKGVLNKMSLKNNKSLMTFVLIVSFLLIFSQAAFAAEGVKLSASSESGVAGEEVTVTISIVNAEGTEGGQFDLSFDSDMVEPVSAARGGFVPDVSGNSFDYNLELEDGKLRVLWVIAAGAEDDSGVVGTITFELLEDGETDLTFSDVVIAPEGAEVASTHTAGQITAMDLDELRQAAIDAADEAIADLPDCDDITLADREDVEAARALVEEAMDEYDVEEDDFADLDKLECAEAKIAKLEAIMAADNAILALPSIDSLTLDDKPAVVSARALVNAAKEDHGAVDDDFDYLATLSAAENRIKELEGLQPTPPTGGGVNYWLFIGLSALAAGGYFIARRKRFATVR